MIYVLLMTLGTMIILFGVLCLLVAIGTNSGIPVVVMSLIIAGIGALIVAAVKPKWSAWYSRGSSNLKRAKTAQGKAEQQEIIRKIVTIKRTQIIGTDAKNKTGSAAGRALVGDFIAGPVGGVVGATTAKRQGYTKFLVEYENGRKEVETVKDNGPRFNELIKYVE